MAFHYSFTDSYHSILGVGPLSSDGAISGRQVTRGSTGTYVNCIVKKSVAATEHAKYICCRGVCSLDRPGRRDLAIIRPREMQIEK